MKTLRNLLLTLFICGLLFIPVSVASAFDGGTGTVDDPYLISTPEQLNMVRGNLSGYYKLVNDIDLISYDNWEPIGNSKSKFAGSLDGNNHKITNLKINRPGTKYQGLFGNTDNTAKISNLGLEDVDVTGNNYVGGLVGNNSQLPHG